MNSCENNTSNKKWLWLLMVLATVSLIVLMCYKKIKNRKLDIDRCEYDCCATGDECISFCDTNS